MKTAGVLFAWTAALAWVVAPMATQADYVASDNTAAVCLQTQGYRR